VSHTHHSMPGFEDEVIDRLYAELSDLYADKESSPEDARLDARIAETFQRLRTAQTVEVLQVRDSFEARLRMPFRAGADLLEQVRQLVTKHHSEILRKWPTS
jgi:uncharacterized membrane-anchored protein YjiN (DUF445 family)